MESKISHNTELSKIKNHRKMLILQKMQKLNVKKKSLEKHSFQRSASIIFVKNKFKISNEFDHKGIKKFLKEKFKYLQPMNLDDSLIEIKDYNKPKDERALSKKKIIKYKENFFYSDISRIHINNYPTSVDQLFSNDSLCLKDLLSNLV